MTTDFPIPAREANPFATCWTRPGALPYLPTAQAIVEQCVAAALAQNCRGQILGAHGAGKSTLLRAIGAALSDAGRPVRWLRAGRGALPASAAGDRDCVFLIDSFEQLSRWRRQRWRRRAWGLIVTSHRPLGLPTLARLAPGLAEVGRCFDLLTRERPSEVTRDDLREAYALHGGNVREIWFDLYDRHERRRRAANQPARGA